MSRVGTMALCLLLFGPSGTQAQCDWPQKIWVAVQRRYQSNENFCKALLAPPAEFNRAHALQEHEVLSHRSSEGLAACPGSRFRNPRNRSASRLYPLPSRSRDRV